MFNILELILFFLKKIIDDYDTGKRLPLLHLNFNWRSKKAARKGKSRLSFSPLPSLYLSFVAGVKYMNEHLRAPPWLIFFIFFAFLGSFLMVFSKIYILSFSSYKQEDLEMGQQRQYVNN